MLDYKLKVFFTVANRLSFSKAAEELHITQPAVTRHIKQIEEHFNQKLFERLGNSIKLTEAGTLFLEHGKTILENYRSLQFDMNALIDETEGILKIAASTTFAQYILPAALSEFHEKFPKVKVLLLNRNTEDVEHAILDKTAELGFTEGQYRNREISYHEFLKDEIVLVVANGHPLFNSRPMSLETLCKEPIVLREEGSGTLEVILDSLQKKGVTMPDLNVDMRLGSSESIKSYLGNKNTVAFLSINTVLRELKSLELGIVDIDGLSMERSLHYIFKHGHQSALSTLFLNFIQHHYNF